MAHQQEKQVTIKPVAGGTERQTEVQPGESPREVLARELGREAGEEKLLRKDGRYLSETGDMYAQVEQGDEVKAAPNPVVG